MIKKQKKQLGEKIMSKLFNQEIINLAKKKLLKKGDKVNFTIEGRNNNVKHIGVFEGFREDGRVIINAAHDGANAPVGECDIKISVSC